MKKVVMPSEILWKGGIWEGGSWGSTYIEKWLEDCPTCDWTGGEFSLTHTHTFIYMCKWVYLLGKVSKVIKLFP